MSVHAQTARTVWGVVGVHGVPEDVCCHTTLADADYVDLFTVRTPAAANGSAEEWARAILEGAQLSRRNARPLWRLMGLRLGPQRSPDHVNGWRITGRGDRWMRVETASWYLTAQAICRVDEGQVSISLSLRYDCRPVAALVWALVAGPHQRAVPVMLHQAARLMAA